MRLVSSLISIFLTSGLVFSEARANYNFEFTQDNECTEKRLDKTPGSASKIPVQDQDGTGLCTAYSMAQLIDAWRAVNNPPITDFTSPLVLGIDYIALTNGTKVSDVGAFKLADKLPNLSSCSYSAMKSHFNSKTPIDFFREIKRNYDLAKSGSANIVSTAQAIRNCVLNSGFSNTLDIETIKSYLNEEDWVKFSKKFFDDACKDSRKSLSSIPKIKGGISYGEKNHFIFMNKYRKTINQQLDVPNALPVGIGYCANVLKDRDAIGVTEKGEFDESSCSNAKHASVIVGRRLLKYKDGDQVKTICQFLVRNTYGSSCNGYDQYEKDALPSNSGETPRVCENGQIWVDENSLMRNTNSVFHF